MVASVHVSETGFGLTNPNFSLDKPVIDAVD
jgi:hypothetical protein